MSAFDNVLLPDRLAYGVKFGPAFSTTVVTTASGGEQRIGQWGRARRKGVVGFDLKPAEADALIAFFLARQGRLRGFRFSDVNDRAAASEPLVNPGGTSLQLIKTYRSGGISVVRTLTKPSATSPFTLYKNGVAMVGGYALDTATGLVTLTAAAPGAAFAWTGMFDTPARFDTDEMDLTHDTFGSRGWSGIPIIELL